MLIHSGRADKCRLTKGMPQKMRVTISKAGRNGTIAEMFVFALYE